MKYMYKQIGNQVSNNCKSKRYISKIVKMLISINKSFTISSNPHKKGDIIGNLQIKH